MRSTLILSAFAALAIAAPRPQDLDFTLVDAAPDPEVYTPPVNGTSQEVDVLPASDAATIGTDEITSTTKEKDKRDFLDLADALTTRNVDCGAEPAGTGPAVTSPDTDAGFLSYQPFRDTALAAATTQGTPQGYSLAFSNLNGSSQTTSYLGYKTLTSYDPLACATYCDQQDGCIAFNIYFERDPTITPADTCPNPPSLTNIKCVRWGVQVNDKTATNMGQWRNDFHVVISGSNGYNKNTAPGTQPGFVGPAQLGGAINAPLDPVNSLNTYMGYKFFSFATVQTFDNGVAACTAACTAQTAYNSRHPPALPQLPNVCNQVVVYVLSQNNQPQGIYCSMYNEEWSDHYATNFGQYRGSDYWSISQAYTYTNATYANQYGPICVGGGCAGGSFGGGNCGGHGAGTC